MQKHTGILPSMLHRKIPRALRNLHKRPTFIIGQAPKFSAPYSAASSLSNVVLKTVIFTFFILKYLLIYVQII